MSATIKQRIEEPVQWWQVRECALGVASVVILATTLSNRLTKWQRRVCFWGGSALFFRTCIYRPLTADFIQGRLYPVHGQDKYGKDLAVYQKEWKECDYQAERVGEVRGRYLNPTGPSNGQVVLFAFGNSCTMDRLPPSNLDRFREMGYHVFIYDPPQYGETPGIRSLQGDVQTFERVVHHLMRKGYSEERISVIGHSIGAHAVTQAAAYYRFKQICLVVPICNTDTTIRRVLNIWFGESAGWVTWKVSQGVVRDYFAVNTAEALKRAKSDRLFIAHAGRDYLMGDDTFALRDAWNASHSRPCDFLSDPDGEHKLSDYHPAWVEWLPQQMID